MVLYPHMDKFQQFLNQFNKVLIGKSDTDQLVRSSLILRCGVGSNPTPISKFINNHEKIYIYNKRW